MLTKKVMRALVAAGVVLSLPALAVSAAASPEAGGPRSSAAVQGIGVRVTPRITTAMYSGPGLSTPTVGRARQGDNVAAVCRLQDNNGKWMVLGIDRPGENGAQWANTAGYIWDLDIIEPTYGLDLCTDRLTVQPSRDTALYSGPGLSTPQIGKAWANEDVAALCKINDNKGWRLVLGVHLAGRNGVQWARTAGYLWDADIRDSTSYLADCGVQ